MEDMGGLIPLKVAVPDSIADYFELTGFEELSQPEVLYDSNFEQVTKSNYKPFDLIATIKARKNTTSRVPFYLLVTYQTCHGKTECFPPARFAVPMNVIGDQPFELNITANVLKSKGYSKLLTLDNQAK